VVFCNSITVVAVVVGGVVVVGGGVKVIDGVGWWC